MFLWIENRIDDLKELKNAVKGVSLIVSGRLAFSRDHARITGEYLSCNEKAELLTNWRERVDGISYHHRRAQEVNRGFYNSLALAAVDSFYMFSESSRQESLCVEIGKCQRAATLAIKVLGNSQALNNATLLGRVAESCVRTGKKDQGYRALEILIERGKDQPLLLGYKLAKTLEEKFRRSAILSGIFEPLCDHSDNDQIMKAVTSLVREASPRDLIDVLHRYVEAQSNHPTESGKKVVQAILFSFEKEKLTQLFACADSTDERDRGGALTPYGKLSALFSQAGALLGKKEELTAVFNAGSGVVGAKQELVRAQTALSPR